MEKVIEQIQQLYGVLKQKLSEVERREAVVSDRERQQNEREAGYASKHQELLNRESAVAYIEGIENRKAENDNRANQLNEYSATLEQDRKKFRIWKEGEESRLAESKKALDAAWKELNVAKQSYEVELNKKVKEFLSKLK